MSIPISPLNDLALIVKLYNIDPVTGAKTPLSGGSAVAFLAISNLPTAVTVDNTLSLVPVDLTGGKWLVSFDGAILTAAILALHFVATPPFLIIQHNSGVRVYVPLVYEPARAAVITT